MIADAALPGAAALPSTVIERQGVLYSAAAWSPPALESLCRRLRDEGPPALEELSAAELFDAWSKTVAAFLEPGSVERRGLDPALSRFCRLPSAALQSGLEAILGGLGGEAARRLIEEAQPRGGSAPTLIVQSSSLPALSIQPLLPALALRQPAILGSPGAEPLFAPAFARALAQRHPALGRAVAAFAWPAGDRALEAPVLAAAARILAYGHRDAIEDLEAQAPGRVVGFRPQVSLAIVAAEADPVTAGRGLARDVALLDQRSGLSVQAVYSAAPARQLAEALAAELAAAARRWPPGPPEPAAAARAQQLRTEADLRGLFRSRLPLAHGTVVVEPLPRLQASPGLRAVRVHPLSDLGRLPDLLAPWQGRLQGCALAGDAAWGLVPELERLGLSRFTPPGELQSPSALWHHGGPYPLETLAV